jgi:hypothetical protein
MTTGWGVVAIRQLGPPVADIRRLQCRITSRRVSPFPVDKLGENHRRIRRGTNSISTLDEMPKHKAPEQPIENKPHFVVSKVESQIAGRFARPFNVEALSVNTIRRAASKTSRAMVDHAPRQVRFGGF